MSDTGPGTTDSASRASSNAGQPSTPRIEAPRAAARVRRIIWATLGWLLTAIGAVLLGAAVWISQTFGPISVDQMLMHLPGAGGGEVTGAEEGYISTFVVSALVIPLAAVAVLAVLLLLVRRSRARARERGTDRVPSQRHLPGRRRFGWVRPLAAVTACLVGVAAFAQAVGAPQYLRSTFSPWTMEDYVVDPEVGALPISAATGDAKPLNLITIYIESGEESLGDDNLFELNMLEPLQNATKGWSRFEPFDVYKGGGWTMAGIVGTECGIPLRGAGISESDINSNDIGDGSDRYMPGATCLGDVLTDAGYHSVFMGGADASFASKENFLTSHGYDEVMDLTTWEHEAEADLGPWGLSDSRLMDHAKEQVTRLHEADQPFHLSVLTLDAHEPVHRYDNCPLSSEDEMVSVVHCSMSSVAGFVDYLGEQGYLDDTVVFITGDHPKMVGEGASFREELYDLPERPLFNRLWVPGGVSIAREHIDQLSVYATLLDVLGLGREDGRAGIGVSARLTSTDGRTMLDLSDADYEELIQSRSAELYERLWSSPGDRTTAVRAEER